jgi:signal recognition particle subunit SRP54
MAFDQLSNRLAQAVKKISGQAKLTEKNMDEMLREVRLALLEADVNLSVIQQFLVDVKEKAVGMDVYTKVNPSQMVVKVVHDELVLLLGEKEAGINLTHKPSIIMMVGLQGTGKTTSAAKLALWLSKKENKKVLLVAADLARPAAIDQLKILGASVGVEVFSLGIDAGVVNTVKESMAYAINQNFDVMIVDTAGRLHVDDHLMDELKQAYMALRPQEVLLTLDAMTGQDIVTVADSFNKALKLSGLVVTKFDGDARGGGVLSVRKVTSVPVKFVGTGEKTDEFELFYPERMASRILGMGDVLSLVEKAEEKMDLEASMKGAQRLMQGTFTLEDMMDQLNQVAKLGSISGLLKMMPGANQLASQINDDDANRQMKRSKAIIQSMTIAERQQPDVLRASRKVRIANGSGTSVAEVNKLLTQFEKTKEQMKMMMRMSGANNPLSQMASKPGSNTRPNPNKKKKKR